MFDICLQTEMAKQGVSLAFFADLRQAVIAARKTSSPSFEDAPSSQHDDTTQARNPSAAPAKRRPNGWKTATPRQSRRDQWDSLCESIGELSTTVARSRDAGVPLTRGLQVLKHYAGAPSWLSEYMRLMVLSIYRNRWETPVVTRQRVEVECISAWKQ